MPEAARTLHPGWESAAIIPPIEDLHPAAYEDLIGGWVAELFDSYVITSAEGTVINAVQTGRGAAAITFRAQGAQYSAVLDGRVCPFCAKLDGLTCRVGSGPYIHYSPPAHTRCRCLWIMIGEDEADFEPDPDEAWDKVLGPSPGQTIVRHAHLNDALRAAFAEDVAQAMQEVLDRKNERAARRLEEALEKQAKRAEYAPDRLQRLQEREAATEARREAKKAAEREARAADVEALMAMPPQERAEEIRRRRAAGIPIPALPPAKRLTREENS